MVTIAFARLAFDSLALSFLADAGGVVGGLVFVAVILGIAILLTVQGLICICQPNEVLVLSGSRVARKGYRIIKGGRAMRLPLFEVVDRMDPTNMPIEVPVTGA